MSPKLKLAGRHLFWSLIPLFSVLHAVKGRIDRIEVFAVQMLLCPTESVGESLVMHDLALAEILDGISDVGVIHQPQNVVVGCARLLFCYYHINTT